MRRALLLPFLVCLCLSAQAQTAGPRWSRVSHLRPASLIEVLGWSGEPERCMFELIDATTLHCIAEIDGAELVYPLGRIGIVYEVRGPRHGLAWLALAPLGLAIAGLVTANPAAMVLGAAGIYGILKATGPRPLGSQFPSPPQERLKLLYWR